jgi:hypothetical protein
MATNTLAQDVPLKIFRRYKSVQKKQQQVLNQINSDWVKCFASHVADHPNYLVFQLLDDFTV